MGQGPSAHTSMLSITNAQAAAFFPGKAVQWPAGPASYSESGKLFFLSLAREPQSLLVCGSPPVQVICLLVNIWWVCQIAWQIHFQMTVPAFKWHVPLSEEPRYTPAAGEQVHSISYQLLIRVGNTEDPGKVTREPCAWQTSHCHPFFFFCIHGIISHAKCTSQNFNLVPLGWQIKFVWNQQGLFLSPQRKEY